MRPTALVPTATVVAVVTALGGCAGASRPVVPNRGKARAPAQAAVDRLSLEEQVGQLVVLSFHGGRVPAYVERILHRRAAAGVILFGDNVTARGQLRGLTRDLQRASGGSALVATDQEGGSARIIRFAAAPAGEASQHGPAAAARAARTTARDLRRLGVNVNLAPVADVSTGAGSVMHARAFPGGAPQVASSVRAAVTAYGREHVLATVKHFPGFGAATANTDNRPVTIGASLPALLGRDLEPFRAAIARHVPLVMVSHALYPALDSVRIASQSRRVLLDLLRRRLRFRGAVVTDSIEARSVVTRSSVQLAAVRSIGAGADLVLMTGPGSYRLVYPRLLAEARRSPRFRRRVRDAASNVIELKRGLGLAAVVPPGRMASTTTRRSPPRRSR